MSGLTFWECLAFTVLGGLGGFLLAYVVDPWLRNEHRLDEAWNEPLEGGLEESWKVAADWDAYRASRAAARPYDWEHDPEV